MIVQIFGLQDPKLEEGKSVFGGLASISFFDRFVCVKNQSGASFATLVCASTEIFHRRSSMTRVVHNFTTSMQACFCPVLHGAVPQDPLVQACSGFSKRYLQYAQGKCTPRQWHRCFSIHVSGQHIVLLHL